MKFMQKLLAFTTAFLLSAAIPLTVSAEGEEDAPQDVTAGVAEEIQYKYGLDEEGNAELYDFLPSDTYEGAVIIPTEIEGHPVDYVGNACFMNAAGITSVTIPASMIDMGDDVFFGCTGLTEFIVEEGNSYYSVKDGVLLADEGKFLVAYPAGKDATSYTVPEGVDEIAPGAFGFAQNLTEVTVTDGVEFIDSWAFAYSNIQKIDIAGSVYQIDDYAFAYCESLHDVTLQKGVENI
ncbi:MAG: leucine-rich repeat domain-containing protein, partial [Oscillospiraceae bacterium]|nr:leucine-rich repeat domain-containing protein [Oscillospiraceae bacterium]